jgi:transposase-like protein
MSNKIYPQHHKRPALLPLSLAMIFTGFNPDDTSTCPECGSDADMIEYQAHSIRYRCNCCGLTFHEPYIKELES